MISHIVRLASAVVVSPWNALSSMLWDLKSSLDAFFSVEWVLFQWNKLQFCFYESVVVSCRTIRGDDGMPRMK